MAVLYTYNELVEKDSAKVSSTWKVLQITVYAIALVSGALCAVWLYCLEAIFDNTCVLYPRHIAFTNQTAGGNTTHSEFTTDTQNVTETNSSIDFDNNSKFNATPTVDMLASRWADAGDYSLAHFAPVLSAVFSLVWITMFVICPAGGKSHHGLPQPWRIVAPAACFAAVFCCVCLYASSDLQQGLAAFCQQFSNLTGHTECSAAIDGFSPRKEVGPFGVHALVVLVTCAGWLHCACWAAALALALLRCCAAPDFQLARTTVTVANFQHNLKIESTGSPDQVNQSIGVDVHQGSKKPASHQQMKGDNSYSSRL